MTHLGAVTRMSEIKLRLEFDAFGSSPKEERKAFIEVHEDGLVNQLFLCVGDQREELLTSIRDMWGVFHHTPGSCVAQEDGTRSFLDALIAGLKHIQANFDHETTSPTEVTNDNGLT